jgi:hypothetical protein
MNVYMLLFLVACMTVGLWAPTRKRLAGLVVACTVALVVFFFFFPSKL